jgi:hypothetical protein
MANSSLAGGGSVFVLLKLNLVAALCLLSGIGLRILRVAANFRQRVDLIDGGGKLRVKVKRHPKKTKLGQLGKVFVAARLDVGTPGTRPKGHA